MKQEIQSEIEFNEFVNTKDLVIVDFYSTWCPPCKALAPILEEITETPIAKVNTEELTDLAGRHKISAVPTLLFFKNGQVVGKMLGLQKREALVQKIQELN